MKLLQIMQIIRKIKKYILDKILIIINSIFFSEEELEYMNSVCPS